MDHSKTASESPVRVSCVLERFEHDAKSPEWASFDAENKHVHDWRTYVTKEVRDGWGEIPLLGRCAVIACCQEAADREEWD